MMVVEVDNFKTRSAHYNLRSLENMNRIKVFKDFGKVYKISCPDHKKYKKILLKDKFGKKDSESVSPDTKDK